jgi:superfamily II DNA or RNA helicase
LDQWIKRIQQFTNLTKGEIGVVQGETCQWNRPFIVAMVHSLAQKNYPPELYKSVGVFISDEVHRIGAATWLQVVPKFPAMYRWGLSATPERPDGMHRAFKLHIGDIVYSMLELDSQPTVYQILTGTQLPQRAISNAWNGKTNFGRMYTALAKDNRRNNIIAEEVKNCWKAGRKILILSKRVQHLGALYHLAMQKGVPVDQMGTVVGQEKNKGDRVRILTTRKVIFASEQIAGLGLDQPDLDTLIWALPSQAVEQNVGRIERVDVPKKNPLAEDLVDDVPLLHRLAQARLKKFHKRGYKVMVVDYRESFR